MKRVSLQAKITFYYHNNHQVCGNACHVHPFSNVDLHLKVIILLEKIWVCGLNIRRERSIQERVKSDEVGATLTRNVYCLWENRRVETWNNRG